MELVRYKTHSAESGSKSGRESRRPPEYQSAAAFEGKASLKTVPSENKASRGFTNQGG